MRERNELILADLVAVRAQQMPDFDVVTFEGGGVRPHEVRTYADLWMNGNRIAAGLIAKGLGKGDRFGLMMRNHPEFIETMVAASLSGGVFVPIDPRTRGEKLAYTLRNSECRGIVCADYALAKVAAVRTGLPNLEWILVLESREEPDSMRTAGVPAASGAPGESDVVAAVVPVDAGTFDPASVFATCVKGLEPNFVPAYLQVVDEIPKTASEKPQDRFLLDRFAPDGPRIYRQ